MENISNHIAPALFVSHGSPMNAVAENSYTQDLRKTGKQLENVNAVVVLSAHWETNGIYVTDSEKLSTVHDFGGFPKELFEVQYPANGALFLIPKIEKLIGESLIRDKKRGLDHGAWSMLKHIFPQANIPVLQMSLDKTKTFEEHFELAKKLAPLREQNVLILLSGNVTHNFSHINFENINAKPLDWALQFDETIKNIFLNSDETALININKNNTIYKLNHPTDDHFIPLLYLMGVKNKTDKVTFPHMSWQYGTMSMRHILLSGVQSIK